MSKCSCNKSSSDKCICYLKEKFEELETLVLETLVTALEPVDSRPYKVYTFTMTQSGTDAPVPNELENTFDGTLSWSRTGTGDYLLTSTDPEFVEGKVFMHKLVEHIPTVRWITGRRFSDTTFQLLTNSNGVPSDNVMGTDSFPTCIEIRVYN